MTMVEVSRVLVFECLLNVVGAWYKFHLKGKGLKGQGVEVAEQGLAYFDVTAVVFVHEEHVLFFSQMLMIF